ncbi:MAG: winged helix-turn-helix domain-containing protein [Candidatus Bathyarchaeota archaeon]|jgi:predicted transcriptional regulator|nr:winged helix-turn-helix domain-containing protein [Candidatus Bathyarchaeota archaeon]MDH5663184.1 winged helix-turn-helix domain-containing protein [Candidatus Bathyarchaeota archaeon]
MIIVVGASFEVGGSLMTEKRSEFDVIADVLRVAALGSKESEIMVGCDLNREVLEKYMPAMVVLKLVSVEKESENFYRATSRGLEFLRFYHGLRWLLWGKDFDFLLINILTRLKKDRHPYYVR